MKTFEMEQKSKSELKEMLEKSREDLRQLYFDLAAGKVKSIKDLRLTRKNIARILTVLNQKSEISAEYNSPNADKNQDNK